MVRDYSNDNILFTGFQQRETLAEKKVFYQYYGPLCLFAERITGQLPVAEDIVTESFEKAWRRRQSFNDLEHLKSFLYSVVRNASLNFAASEKVRQDRQQQLLHIYQDAETSDEDREREILRAEMLMEIYEEIEQLPDRCGQIFKLLFIHGLTTSEIAEKLSINVQTVRTQKARAIELIRTELLRKNRIPTLLLLITLLEKTR